MNAQRALESLQDTPVPGPGRRPDPGHQPDDVRRRLLRPHGAGDGEGVCGDGRPGEGRDRQPGREPDGRPLLAPRAGTGPRRRRSRRRSATPSPRSRRSRRTCTRARSSRRRRRRFTQVLSIGIGGSALGPDVRRRRAGRPGRGQDGRHFIDNTDPDGIARVLARLGGKLGETLVVVISKSGGTPETRNGMLVVADAYQAAGPRLRPPRRRHHRRGLEAGPDRPGAEGWLARFPMWDWVGGRTSEMSAVGLLPAAAPGDRHRRHARRRRRDATRRPASTTRRTTPPPCSP